MTDLPNITINDLLDSGVHFGHKKSRWNPKMAPYIYGIKDDIHIIDLQQTAGLFKKALKFVSEIAKNNGKILFVGTKIQAGDIIAEYAEKCGQYYVNHRWLGGMLTNSTTINKSLKRLDAIEKTMEDEELATTYTKKELLDFSRQREKLQNSLGGIRNLKGKPDLLFIIDTNKEHIAVKEAIKLGIPIVAVSDTNTDPEGVDYVIPGNDDAIRSIKYYCEKVSDAVLAGIQESLVESGVDIGELSSSEGVDTKTVVQKVKKLNSNKRRADKPHQESSSEFEKALESSNIDQEINKG